MAGLRCYIEDRLKLKINEHKSAVASPSRRKFLGYSVYKTRGQYRLRVHDKSIGRLKEEIKAVTNRNVSMNLEIRINQLAVITRGWVNYYKLADMKSKLKTLDEWTRRRLRACIWKTWKHIRTRFANLKQLGVPVQKAWEYANTRKGFWRISKSPNLNHTITNAYLRNRGYIGMSTMFAKS